MALTNPGYSKLPKKNNIQGFWRMEETSGTRYDLSTNKNHLTDNNTVGYAAGKIGNAADFEVSNSEYLSITDASQKGLDITGGITLACWIKPESIALLSNVMDKYDYGSNNRAYKMWITSDGNKVFGELSSNGSNYTYATSANNVISAGTWVHICFTLNQTTDKIQVYINGSASGATASFTENIYNSNAPFTIGCQLNNGTPMHLFDGLIDEAIIWNTCLTADEIAEVYRITKYNAGILLWWFCKDSWEKHDKLWKPKILIPEYQI